MRATLAAFGFEPAVYRALAQHRKGHRMLRELADWASGGADAFDAAEALYFLAYLYGEGQDCPLRAASNATGLRPGLGMLSRNEPEPDSTAAAMFSRLEKFV